MYIYILINYTDMAVCAMDTSKIVMSITVSLKQNLILRSGASRYLHRGSGSETTRTTVYTCFAKCQGSQLIEAFASPTH